MGQQACPRPRVFELLDCARERPLVWLSGPAGAGKSAALASYLQARGIGYTWHHHGRGAWPGPQVLRSLFGQLPSGHCLVLDDCPPPSAETAAWYEQLVSLGESIGAGRNVALLSRSELPACLTRLLAASALSNVTWQELRFREEEAELLVSRLAARQSRRLSAAQTGALIARADGWAAGMALALEASRLRHGAELDAHRAGEREISAFLMAEAWADVPEAERGVLLQTAFLPSLDRSLLEALYGAAKAPLQLAIVRAATGFVIEEPGGEGVRYAEPFRKFLLALAQLAWSPQRLGAWARKADHAASGRGALGSLKTGGAWVGNGTGVEEVGPVVPEPFLRTVKSALRHLHQTQQLLSSPLLHSGSFAFREGGGAARVQLLRALLLEVIERLSHNERTCGAHHALRHTFVAPAATQLLAAERCAMSFGTYRRHLRAGVEQVAAELWIRAGEERVALEPGVATDGELGMTRRAS